MLHEKAYTEIASRWNYGINYRINNYLNISAQQLYGSTFSITASLLANLRGHHMDRV